jgi:hypothetical protein
MRKMTLSSISISSLSKALEIASPLITRPIAVEKVTSFNISSESFPTRIKHSAEMNEDRSRVLQLASEICSYSSSAQSDKEIEQTPTSQEDSQPEVLSFRSRTLKLAEELCSHSILIPKLPERVKPSIVSSSSPVFCSSNFRVRRMLKK